MKRFKTFKHVSAIVCREHHMIHTKVSGVDVEEVMRTMGLLRQRLAADKLNLLAPVSCTYIHMQ